MIINVYHLRHTEGASKTFRFIEEFSPLQLGTDEYTFTQPAEVTLDIENLGKSLLVKGTIRLVIAVNCSRCLKPFTYSSEITFEDEWFPAEFASEAMDESAFIFEKDEFAIDDRIIEQIVLQLPMKFLCSEDCKGLCLKCGADLNTRTCSCISEDIDPRFEILSKWNKGV
ncbi:DUF177 domain-containing protein [Dehalobacter sp. DCM]|uniref:YceD family protein n=1 Tax=Dehalobacter sp. DCM TaxID=2907827 RepID=UPI003081DC12|nr:DUF177 domain-containing protein [Dehalobacter sp. DCM]